MKPLLVAGVQMCSGSDKEQNVSNALDRVEWAASRGAKIIVIPENFTLSGYRDRILSNAEPIPGPTISRFAKLAKKYGCYLVCGSTAEQNRNGGKPYNSTAILGPAGELLGIYRKMHLFHIVEPEKTGFASTEDAYYEPGDDIAVVDTNFGKLGAAICNDLRFPDLFSLLSEAGVVITAVPSGFTRFTGPYHWEHLIRARAIENQMFIIAINQTGVQSPVMSTYGNSMIVNPWGKVVARLGEDPGILMAEIDLSQIEEIRAKQSLKDQRKTGLYAKIRSRILNSENR